MLQELYLLTCIKGTKKFDFLNIGSGRAVSIKKLVKTLKKIVFFKETYEMKKNSGFTKRVLDMKNTRKTLNFRPYYSLYEGLHETWNWYLKIKIGLRKKKLLYMKKKIKNLKSILINFEKDIKIIMKRKNQSSDPSFR